MTFGGLIYEQIIESLVCLGDDGSPRSKGLYMELLIY